ncbi:MAG: Bug family tripartite tricarboxylate transporter substrate binding protein [Alphaproteobacteria bacterium]
MSAFAPKAVAVALLALSVSALSVSATAQSVEEFYKSRPLTVLVGYSPGGGYDTHVRGVMRYYSRHLPGNPTITVQNMTGAGSLVATNHLYNLAAKDGSVIGMVRAPVLEPLTGTSASNFDATKFNWIGSGMTEFTVCALLGAPTVKTFADATKTQITLAGSGPGSDDDMISKMLIKLLGLKAKVVSGYPGGNEMQLAVERGEVDGRCGWSFTSIKLIKPEWITENKLKFLASLSMERWPELPDTPSIMEIAQTEEQKSILKVAILSADLGRPFMAPPGVPADRVAALRDAFVKTIKDPDYVAEVTKRKETPTLVDGQRAEAIIKDLFSTPPEVLKKAKAIVNEK